MYKRRGFEIIVGVIVLAVLSIFITYMVRVAEKTRSNSKSYSISAYFNEVGGLAPGNQVLIKGVIVGSVNKVLVEENSRVKVILNLSNDIKLPNDSTMVIKDTDFLSGRKVELKPGHAKDFIKANGLVKNTKNYEYLEDKINKIIFSSK